MGVTGNICISLVNHGVEDFEFEKRDLDMLMEKFGKVKSVSMRSKNRAAVVSFVSLVDALFACKHLNGFRVSN